MWAFKCSRISDTKAPLSHLNVKVQTVKLFLEKKCEASLMVRKDYCNPLILSAKVVGRGEMATLVLILTNSLLIFVALLQELLN